MQHKSLNLRLDFLKAEEKCFVIIFFIPKDFLVEQLG